MFCDLGLGKQRPLRTRARRTNHWRTARSTTEGGSHSEGRPETKTEPKHVSQSGRQLATCRAPVLQPGRLRTKHRRRAGAKRLRLPSCSPYLHPQPSPSRLPHTRTFPPLSPQPQPQTSPTPPRTTPRPPLPGAPPQHSYRRARASISSNEHEVRSPPDLRRISAGSPPDLDQISARSRPELGQISTGSQPGLRQISARSRPLS